MAEVHIFSCAGLEKRCVYVEVSKGMRLSNGEMETRLTTLEIFIIRV